MKDIGKLIHQTNLYLSESTMQLLRRSIYILQASRIILQTLIFLLHGSKTFLTARIFPFLITVRLIQSQNKDTTTIYIAFCGSEPKSLQLYYKKLNEDRNHDVKLLVTAIWCTKEGLQLNELC